MELLFEFLDVRGDESKVFGDKLEGGMAEEELFEEQRTGSGLPYTVYRGGLVCRISQYFAKPRK